MSTKLFIIIASTYFIACSDDAPKLTAPPPQTKPSYYCSINGVTYKTEVDYRSSCVIQSTPQSSSNIKYSSSSVSSSSTLPNTSSSIQTTPKETTQSVSCVNMNFTCSSVYAFSAKQACESLEQNLVVNGLYSSGPGKKQAIQLMIQYNCKCEPNKDMKEYMASVGCLQS